MSEKMVLNIFTEDKRLKLLKHPVMEGLRSEWQDSGLLKKEVAGDPVKLVSDYIFDVDVKDMSMNSFLEYYLKSGDKRRKLINDRSTVSEHALNYGFGRDNNDLLEITREFYVYLNNKGFFRDNGEVPHEILFNTVIIRLVDTMFFRVNNIIKLTNTFNKKEDSRVVFKPVNSQVALTADIDVIVYSKESELMVGFIKVVKGVTDLGTYNKTEYDLKQESLIRRVFNLDIAYVSIAGNNITATLNLKDIANS